MTLGLRRLLCAVGIHSYVEPLWYWTPDLVCKRCYHTIRKPGHEIAQHWDYPENEELKKGNHRLPQGEKTNENNG